MYSTMDRQTLTECCLVFGITCLLTAMRPATSDANNSVTSQQAQSLSLSYAYGSHCQHCLSVCRLARYVLVLVLT